jgi:hypothetical protein
MLNDVFGSCSVSRYLSFFFPLSAIALSPKTRIASAAIAVF